MWLEGSPLNSATAGSAHINAKERDKNERKVRRVKKRKWIEAQRVKHPTSSRATDALIGDEEQNGKQQKEKEKQGVGPQTSNPGPFSHLLRHTGIIR